MTPTGKHSHERNRSSAVLLGHLLDGHFSVLLQNHRMDRARHGSTRLIPAAERRSSRNSKSRRTPSPHHCRYGRKSICHILITTYWERSHIWIVLSDRLQTRSQLSHVFGAPWITWVSEQSCECQSAQCDGRPSEECTRSSLSSACGNRFEFSRRCCEETNTRTTHFLPKNRLHDSSFWHTVDRPRQATNNAVHDKENTDGVRPLNTLQFGTRSLKQTRQQS